MSRMQSFHATAVALGLMAMAIATTPARAGNERSSEDERTEQEIGLDVASGLLTLVYAPAKVLYAAGGGIVAGLAYALSAGDTQVTKPILTPALHGDYYVTPAHLRGEKPLEFVGRAPEEDAQHDASAPPLATAQGGDGLDSAPAVSSEPSDPAESPGAAESQ